MIGQKTKDEVLVVCDEIVCGRALVKRAKLGSRCFPSWKLLNIVVKREFYLSRNLGALERR